MSYSTEAPFEELGIDEYQVSAGRTEQEHSDPVPGLAFPLLGLIGETGTLLSALKKKQRDGEAYDGYRAAYIEELGDVLWYLANVASKKSIQLSHLLEPADDRRSKNDQGSETARMFKDLQNGKSGSSSLESPAVENSLIRLASLVGLLSNDFPRINSDENIDLLKNHLKQVLEGVLHVANEAKIDLNEVAVINLRKARDRWPEKREFLPLFDQGRNSWEQFPRTMSMTIREIKFNDRVFVVQQWNGVTIGSHIDDLKMEADDYRFHDAFHLAYMAILGWSPVLRGLFKLHRKNERGRTSPEDDLRAIYTEEGISTLIFQRSLPLKFFEGLPRLDYPLLKLIPDLVKGFEVHACPSWQWETAILEGFRIFRLLRDNRGGIVSVDLDERIIAYEKLPAEMSGESAAAGTSDKNII